MFQKARRFLTVTLVVLLIVSGTGCWDQIEIEQRTFVIGMGIDRVDPEALKPVQILEGGLANPRSNQMLISMEIPKLQATGVDSGNAGGNSGKGKPAWLISTTGVNIAQAAGEIRVRTNRQVFLGHLRLVIVGESFARKQNLRKTLDFLFRSPEIQRETAFFIANGTARDVLSVTPPDDQLAALYINNITSTERFTGRFFYTTIGDIASKFANDGNFLVGRIRPEKAEAVSGGLAVIKNWKLMGFLGERETIGVNLLMNRLRRETITVCVPEGEWYGVKIYGIRRKIQPVWNNGYLTLKYSFRTEGEIWDASINEEVMSSPKLLKKLEHQVEESLERSARAALHQLQTKYRTDAIHLGNYIRKHWPEIWRKLEPRWQEDFPKLKIEFLFKHKMRRAGEVL